MIGHLAYELWLQLWPNMFSPSLWTIVAIVWHHFSLKNHMTALAVA